MFDTQGPQGGSNTTVIAIALTCVFVGLLLLALLIIALRRRNQNNKPGPAQANDYQDFGVGESADAAVYSTAQNSATVILSHQTTDKTGQNTYSTISQAEIATYSTLSLDPVASQSNSRAQDIDQSTYSTLDHEGRFNQSQPQKATTSQSGASVYSAFSDSDQQTGHEMVENILYGSR